MKRKTLLMLLLMALFAPLASFSQTTVEIGEGTSTMNSNPIGTYWNYSITEQLYTAEEIGRGGTISSVSFYFMGIAERELPITMYMKHVDEENLASAGISLADADEVFSGTLTVTTTEGWVTIDLDTPFAYDGTSNLLIGFIKDYAYYFNGSSWKGTSMSSAMARYSQNDNNAYDTSTVPSSTQSTRPNIQMVITAGGSGTVCEKPATIEASNVTANSATLTWTGGSGTYNVEYQGGSVTEWTSYLTNTTATTANLTGLNPGTSYQYRVQSVCGDQTSGWKNVSFKTMFGIPLVEEFGTAIPTGWARCSGALADALAGTDPISATYVWSFGTINGVFDNHAYANIYGSSCTKWLVLPTIAMEDNVQLQFEVAYTAYSGTAAAPAQTGTDDKFVVLANVGRGWTILRQWDNAGSEFVLNDLGVTPITVKLDLSSFAGQNVAVAFYVESTESNADNNLHIDNVSIDYKAACESPTSLAVNYESGTTATVTWADADVCEIDVNGTVYTNKTSPFQLTGLELATTYEVKARQNCGAAGYSEWVGPVSFKTDLCMPEDKCTLTFEVTDSYGDGWNGASIDIYDYTGGVLGDLLASITNQNLDGVSGSSQTEPETQTFTYDFCNGQELAIIWNSGSYDSECSYTITDINGDIVAQDDTGLGIAYTMDCTITDCRRPSDFVASEIGPRSVVLSWTENGPATEWIIEYISENDEETTIITVDANPYTLTGLTPETMYAAQVTPVCEIEKPSEVIYWTTEVACPAPSDLEASGITYQSAHLSWTGFGESYDLRYMPLGGGGSKNVAKSNTSAKRMNSDQLKRMNHQLMANPDAQPKASAQTRQMRDGWYYYDNGTSNGSIGTGSATDVYWAIMLPGGMTNNTTLTKVSFYSSSEYDATITLSVYTGGTDAPGTLLYTEDIEPEAADAFQEVTLATPVDYDCLSNLWVVLKQNGEYPAQGCVNTGDPNGRWISLNGTTWKDVYEDYGLEYTWMIRAYCEGEVILPWIDVTGINANEYDLIGLEAETQYTVQVRSNCGDDGMSNWASVNFTTGSMCDVPYELTVTNLTATSATLNWTNGLDQFNVRYREVVHGEILESQDFDDNSMGNWTTIDADGDGYDWVLGSECGGVYLVEGGSLAGAGHNSSADLVVSGSYSNMTGVGALTPDNYLVSPQVTLGGTITFWACGQDAEYAAEHFGVAVSTTSNTDATTFTTIAEWTLSASGTGSKQGTWGKFTVDLSAYSGQGYVAIRHFDCTDMFMLDVDDIVIESRVDMPGWIETVVEGNSCTISGLTPETPYEWQVQGENKSCDDGVTEWSDIAEFTTLEASAEEEQTITLPVGWGWFSSYIEYPANALDIIQNDIALTSSTGYIKGQFGFNTYDSDHDVWEGDLTDMVNEKMYLIKSEGAETSLTGPLADPTAHPITVKNGWNWIGFISPNPMTPAEALASLTPSENDMIKGQNGFCTYSAADGWNGDLVTMDPGEGFMYKHSGSDDQLVYPTRSKGIVETTPVEKYWNANHSSFPTNLTMMVTLDGQYGMFKGSHEIGAFVNGECRGSARLQEVGGKYIAFLTVSGDPDEEVGFKLFDVTNNKEYTSMASERIVYSADAIYGSVNEPMTLHFNMTGVEEYEGYISLFPNPAKDKVRINGNGIQTLKVYNAMGQLIHEEDCSNAEQVELNLGSFSSGVYTVNVVMANGQTVNKMMVKE